MLKEASRERKKTDAAISFSFAHIDKLQKHTIRVGLLGLISTKKSGPDYFHKDFP